MKKKGHVCVSVKLYLQKTGKLDLAQGLAGALQDAELKFVQGPAISEIERWPRPQSTCFFLQEFLFR